MDTTIAKKPKEEKKTVQNDINILEKITALIKPLDKHHAVYRIKNVYDNKWRITFHDPQEHNNLTAVFLEVDKDNNITIIEDGRRKFFNNPMIKSAIKF